jgi:hypothetical protein
MPATTVYARMPAISTSLSSDGKLVRKPNDRVQRRSEECVQVLLDGPAITGGNVDQLEQWYDAEELRVSRRRADQRVADPNEDLDHRVYQRIVGDLITEEIASLRRPIDTGRPHFEHGPLATLQHVRRARRRIETSPRWRLLDCTVPLRKHRLRIGAMGDRSPAAKNDDALADQFTADLSERRLRCVGAGRSAEQHDHHGRRGETARNAAAQQRHLQSDAPER